MSDKNRHMFSDNYRNTILDPVINQAPLSFLTFQCGECGTKFINYKSKVIHQKNYCIKANENSDIEKDLLRLRSIDYVSKPITPVIPLGLEYGSAAFTTKYSQPYIYDRMFKKYDHYKKPTLTQYSIYDYDDELSRELYTPTLDSHRRLDLYRNRDYTQRFKGLNMNSEPTRQMTFTTSNLPVSKKNMNANVSGLRKATIKKR